MSEMHGPAAHRWFCGALGRYNKAEYERLRELIGARPEAIHAGDGVVLHSRTPPSHTVLDCGSQVWRWEPYGPTLRVSAGRTVLGTDESGVVPVFVYRRDDSVLFSSSLDALARSLSRKLHTDWAAWSEIISCMAVLGERTPFEEIRRLPPSTTVTCTSDRLTVEEHAWPWAEETATAVAAGSGNAAADRIIETVTDAVRSVPNEPLLIPLSGGWDSRFLATVASGQQRSPYAVTAPTESGKDEEIEWAQAVAKHLGIKHTVLSPIGWETSFAAVADRVDHLTSMHFWLLPLAEWLEKQRGVLLDGLGGHLIKGTFVPSAVFENGDKPYAPISESLSGRLNPDELLAAPLAKAARSHVDRVFRDEWLRWVDHPSGPTLCVYRLRTIAGIVLSPMMLLASSASAFVPFIHPAVARTALTVPSKAKVGGAFYRQLLLRLDPGIARIPSPHDMKPKQVTKHAPIGTPAAVQEVAQLLSYPALTPLMGAALREKLAERQLSELVVTREGRRVVQGLAVLSLWTQRYETLLADAGELPWQSRRKRVQRAPRSRHARPHVKEKLSTFVGTTRRLWPWRR